MYDGPNPFPQSHTVISNTRSMEIITLFSPNWYKSLPKAKTFPCSSPPFISLSLNIYLSGKSIHTSNILHCLKLSKQPETLNNNNIISFHSVRTKGTEEPILVCWSRKVIMLNLISSLSPLSNSKTSTKWPHAKQNERMKQLRLSKLDVMSLSSLSSMFVARGKDSHLKFKLKGKTSVDTFAIYLYL